MDNSQKVLMKRIFYKYGKPWEDRLIVRYDSIQSLPYRVNAKTWQGKVINMEFFRSGIITYYA